MKKQTKRVVSILLTLLMLIGLVPMAAFSASAESDYKYQANSWYALEMYLKAAGNITITITGDITNTHDMGSEGHKTLEVYGNKIINLNGHKIECVDKTSNAIVGGEVVTVESEKTMFHVDGSSSLTINDSKGGGEIAFKGDHLKESKNYFHYAKRDVFSVDGTLVVNAGKITAGSQGKEYIYKGEEIESVWGSLYSDWSGNVQQVTWGTAANVNEGGKLIVNGGELYGRGIHVYQNTKTYKAVMGQRDEVVYIAEGGTASVNGGSFIALEGANVFAGDGVKDGLKVRDGKFELKKPSTIRFIYDKELYADHYRDWGLAELVSSSTIGSFNIPQSAYSEVYEKLIVKYDGKEYKGFSEISALNFDKEDYKKDLSVEFMPNNDPSIHDAELELHYGTKVYDNAQTQYEYFVGSADKLKLYCNFEEEYYPDYDGDLVYVWSVWVDDNEGEADHEFFTNYDENYINPLVFMNADLTGKTVFVSAYAYEYGPNNSGVSHYTTSFKLSPVDKPMGYLEITDEQPLMPEGENTTFVESYTESWVGYNFNHKPLPQELIDAGYYVERVYSLQGPKGTEIPETKNTGTNRIEFGTMYSEPGVYTLRMGLRLKDKDGNIVDTLGHKFNVFVNSTRTVYDLRATVPAPVAGTSPTEKVSPAGEGFKTTDIDWSYYDAQDDAYYIMPDGMTFEAGKTYECAVQFEAMDNYKFPIDKADASGYINGFPGVISPVYSETRAYVTVKFTVPFSVIFTEDSKAQAGSKLTVDLEAMAEMDEEFMEAYLNDDIECKWFFNGKLFGISDTFECKSGMVGLYVGVRVNYGDKFVSSEEFVIEAAPAVAGILGDADEDSKVNVKDATAIQKHIAGLITLTQTGEKLADVDSNTTVNIKDATAIQKHIAGMNTGYKIGEAVS